MRFRHTGNLLVTLLVLFGLPAILPAEGALHTEALPASADKICPLLTGSKVPELTLKTVAGESFDLNKAIGSKPTILIFYRGGW